MKIKTRESLKTIKTFDRAGNLASKTKGGLSELTRDAEETQDSGYESGTEYAGNQVQGAEQKGIRNAIYGADRVGRWGVKETRQNISKWRKRKHHKMSVPKSKALPSPERQLLSAPKTAQRTAKNAQKTAKTTAKASQKAAKAAKQAAQVTIKTAKITVKATIAAVKATFAAVKGLIAAIAAGGWIAVVIIVAICVIGIVFGSIFGIFQSKGSGDYSLNQVRFEVENESAELIELYKAMVPHDYAEIRGEPDGWKEAIAIYMVKHRMDEDDRDQILALKPKHAEQLKAIYKDFIILSVKTETRVQDYVHLAQNEDGEWVEIAEQKEYVWLVFEYATASLENVVEKQKLNKKQQKNLNDLLSSGFDEVWEVLFQ